MEVWILTLIKMKPIIRKAFLIHLITMKKMMTIMRMITFVIAIAVVIPIELRRKKTNNKIENNPKQRMEEMMRRGIK